MEVNCISDLIIFQECRTADGEVMFEKAEG
jgi:hypothetical protein